MLSSIRPIFVLPVAGLLVLVAGCPGTTDGTTGTTQVSVPFDLEGANIGNFDLEAGVPQRKLGMFTIDTGGITAGEGFLEFKASAVTITITDPEDQKRMVAAQIVDTQDCLDACNNAEVEPDTCSTVCEDNTIDLRIWVNDFESVSADCTDGIEYHALIVLDQDNEPTGEITVDPNMLTDETLELINSGEFGACFQAIAPFNGEVLIEEMVVSVSP